MVYSSNLKSGKAPDDGGIETDLLKYESRRVLQRISTSIYPAHAEKLSTPKTLVSE